MEVPNEEAVFASIDEMLEKASDLVSSSSLEDVLQGRSMFEHVLNTVDRTNPGIVFSLGVSYMRQERYGLAEHLFLRTIDLLRGDETDASIAAPVWNNLGFIYNMEGRRKEAREAFQKAIEWDPKQSEYYNNMATGYVNTATPKKALEWIAKALAIDPDNHDANWNRGLANLEMYNWEEGWDGYMHGLRGNAIHSSQKRKQRYLESPEIDYWLGDATDGIVAVYGEQGVGDEILAASVLEDASKKAPILFECHPRLVNIFRHSFPHIPIMGTRKIVSEQVNTLASFDIKHKAPIFNLCGLFRTSDSDFPRLKYLVPFDDKRAEARAWLDSLPSDKPRIGISWKGGSTLTRNDLRSIPLMEWKHLFGHVDAEWVSLQYDPADRPGWNTAIAKQFVEETGIEINHRQDWVNDLDMCYGGLIHELDLIISVNTSLVHACGAYGVKCWTLTPSQPAWRYGLPNHRHWQDSQMPWYGDWVVQIRQAPEESWSSVFDNVISLLERGF
jgi:hypothetical protein